MLLLVGAVLLLAYANGSNDNFKGVATVYGSGTLPYRGALGLATAAQVVGSIASVALADALLKAFSGKGLVPPEVVGDPSFLLAVGVGGALAVLAATRVGLPVSTTHALIGGLVGAGLALSQVPLQWGALGAKYLVPLLVSPLLALGAAGVLYPVARGARRALGISATTCVCIGQRADPVAVAPDGTMVLAASGVALTVDERQACARVYAGSLAGVSAQPVVNAVHTMSAFALGFARGLNDTPKVLALLVAAGWSGVHPRVALAAVAIAMALGGVLHARRVAETMGHRITRMNCGQGMLANTVSSVLVIGASLLGSPVSTTHVSTGAIFGIGVWTGSADVRVIGGILLAWVGTLPLAAAIAYLVAWVA